MIEIKPFIELHDTIKRVKPHEEMMVFRDDILLLLRYITIPNNDHACEHPDLIECVERLTRDFDIQLTDKYGIDEDVIDYSIGEAVIDRRNFENAIDYYWHNN